MTAKGTFGQDEVPAKVPAGPKKVGQRRTRSPHPGVVLIKPDAKHPTHRARYVDPDTGRTLKARIDPLTVRTAEARRQWAIALSRRIAKRTMELEAGAHRATGTALRAAVERFYEDNPRLRPRTIEIYRLATDKLLTFADRHGITSADDLTPPNLLAFRAELARVPKRAAASGGRRGASKAGRDVRKPAAVNVELRAVRTVLGYLRRLGLLPRVALDDLSDGLKALSLEHERGAMLRSPELRALLSAAMAHDAQTFEATREEHAGARPKGTTPRYQPIAPMVAAAMLTGMRAGELVSLEWSQVDLEAREIHLSSATKTKRARTIDLEVSPALVELLERIRPTPARGSVFGLSSDGMKAAAKRLANYGAPKGWTWQALRRTCGTFLTCAPGIFGAASAYRSARQLGHSVAIAERHYVGVVKVPKEATTLEEAMGVESLVRPKGPALEIRA
jgi:integrase